MAPGRAGPAVQVPIDVHRGRRQPTQGRVREDEDRIGVADGRGVLPVEPGGRRLPSPERVRRPARRTAPGQEAHAAASA